jgi:hypothetical protein
MNIFSINLTVNEITFLRQALEPISIQGRDAKFVASLQLKLEQELNEIQNMIQEAETQKAESLQEAIKEDQKTIKRHIK